MRTVADMDRELKRLRKEVTELKSGGGQRVIDELVGPTAEEQEPSAFARAVKAADNARANERAAMTSQRLYLTSLIQRLGLCSKHRRGCIEWNFFRSIGQPL
jgi:hypothetical protein